MMFLYSADFSVVQPLYLQNFFDPPLLAARAFWCSSHIFSPASFFPILGLLHNYLLFKVNAAVEDSHYSRSPQAA
jgi:hypothetical protein